MRLWGFFLLAAFLFSCSSSNYYSHKELSKYLFGKREFSPDSEFSILLAPGWRKIIDNKSYSTNLWLVNKNTNETIHINKINTNRKIDDKTLLSLMKSYRINNYSKQLMNFQKNDIFLNHKKYSGFSYINQQEKKVFVYLCDIDNGYFEYVYITGKQTLSKEAAAMLSSIELNNKTKQ